MISSISSISVEDYLRSSAKPVCEYIDGVLRPKAMPTKQHALIQYRLVTILRSQGIEALSEVSVRVSPTRFLVPDVIADPLIQDPYPTTAVMLCVEILSPEDRLSTAFAKCEEYHLWGVPYCWIVDPLKQAAWEYHSTVDPVHREQGTSLHAGELTASLTVLFRRESD